MKKLNRKGFTLVELLAVIIVLAIVVGITIPAITNVINDSKNNALEVALNTAEKYIADQYDLLNINYNSTDAEFKYYVKDASLLKLGLSSTGPAEEKALLKKMGFELKNIKNILVEHNNGDVCITALAIPTTSDYYSTANWKSDGSYKDTALNKSKGCS